jgi:glycosyltransferase involved in cell wall biosynthesis
LTWWKHARYVAETLRQFDGCTVVSANERRLLKTLAPASLPIEIVPNGVDTSHLGGKYGAVRPNRLIYTGALTYSANLDAMHYFVKEILPLALAQNPDIKLSITGRTTNLPADALPTHPNVELTGYLPDIRPAVATSAVSIVPLRIGGGTRLKILESLALGAPVVTTSKGLEGLDLTPGADLLVADNPADFSAAILHLLQDEALRNRLGAAGRAAVQKYDWQQVGQTLDTFITQIAQLHHASYAELAA